MKQIKSTTFITYLLVFAIGVLSGWNLHSFPDPDHEQEYYHQTKRMGAGVDNIKAPAPPPDSSYENRETECIPCNEFKDKQISPHAVLSENVSDIKDKSPSGSEMPIDESILEKPEAALLQMAKEDPETFIENVLEQYRPETELNTREWLADLMRSANPGTLDKLSFKLAVSDDPLKRRLAFELLQNKSLEDPEVWQTVLYALENEYDAETLALACRAANPALLPDHDADQIADRLRNLARHEDPAVRGWSIIQLAAWDKESADVVEFINAGLIDTSPEVMNCALSAINAAHLQNRVLQSNLLNIASDTRMQFETRETAVRLLSESPLNDSERNRLKLYAGELTSRYQQSEGSSDNE